MKKYLALGLASSLLCAANGFATNRTTQYFTASVGYNGISKPSKIIQENIFEPVLAETTATGLVGNLEWRTSRGKFTWDLGWGVLTRLCGPCYDMCSWINAVFDVHYRRLGSHNMKAVFVPTNATLTEPTTVTNQVVPFDNVLRSSLTYYGLDFAAGILAAVGDSERFTVRAQLGAMVVNSVHQFNFNSSSYTVFEADGSTIINNGFLPSLGNIRNQNYRESRLDLAPEARVGIGYRFTCDFWGEFNYTHVFGRKLQLLSDNTAVVGSSPTINGFGQVWQYRAPRFDILEVSINYKV